MANDRLIIPAGFDQVQYATIDTDGYLKSGDSATAPSAGTAAGSGMSRLWGAKTVPLQIPAAEPVTATGDNRALVQFSFPGATLPSGVLQNAVQDFNFEALVRNVLVENIDDQSVTVENTDNETAVLMAMILQGDAKSFTPTSVGVKRYYGWYINGLEVRPYNRDAFTERAVGVFNYGLFLSKMDRNFWGSTLTIAANGTKRATFRTFTADYPVTAHRFTGNASRTQFGPLTYTPAAVTKVSVFVNGVKSTYTTDFTVSLTTKVVTFVSAPASGAIIVVLYEYLPES
jgi:hypothetical protein